MADPDDLLTGLTAALPDVRFGRRERLHSGERAQVERVEAWWPDGTATSVVAKHFPGGGEGWARECAALESMPPDAPVPAFVAAHRAPPVLVSADLGTGPSVADALTGDDPDDAGRAMLLWAEGVGRLHAATAGHRDAFRAALNARAGDLPIAAQPLAGWVDESVERLQRHCDSLGVEIPAGALRALRELPRALRASEACALSPADTCPDNNVRTDAGLVLVDFEGAEWRHVAWDVAYLAVPWPSCWCAWRVPGELVERALERYRTAAESRLPYVRSAGFRADVAAAAVGWAVLSSVWFLTNALAGDPPSPDPARCQPPRQAMILHRLDLARRTAALESVGELAIRLREVLLGRWGEVPLRLAPAFAAER